MPSRELEEMRESKSYQATNGKTIICKAAVAWAAKQPLDVTDIQVLYCVQWG